ncbi:MAG TPA: universal stress protein, partial [Bacteroidia bacterium]|nr:universal stress protein [Bacteroidia bacterium]
MEKIIIAVDLNEQTHEVVALGIRLAKQLNASVELLTVIDQSLDFTVTTEFNFDNRWEARLFVAKTELTKIKNQHPEMFIDVVTFIGSPKDDIIKQSVEKQASFIVIGTHGRSAFVQFVLGGTAEFVVRHSTVPVIVLPYT